MAVSRQTMAVPVDVDCPVCDRPLPCVLVNLDARADGYPGGPRRVTHVDVDVEPLDAVWWAQARQLHPDCIPPDMGAP
jgi:hypothetical protein